MTTERTEYRAISPDGRTPARATTSLEQARKAALRFGKELRIQSRTVTESSWTDLPEEGER